MNSPLKGIERISEELRLERQKANNALQDRARLRVEIESLKQAVDQQLEETNEFREHLNTAQEENENLRKELDELRREQVAVQEDLDAKNEEVGRVNTEKLQLQSENDNIRESLKEKESLIAAMSVKIESFENRTSAKDELIANLKSDIQQIRKSQLQAEHEKVEVHSLLAQQAAINEELKSQLQMAEVMETSYNQTKHSNEELRVELEHALQANSALTDQARELNRVLAEKVSTIAELDEEAEKLRVMHEHLRKENADLEQDKENILGRVQAEVDAGEAARERAEAAARGRDFLDRQVRELREAHEKALSYSSSLEEQVTELKTSLADLQAEFSAAKEKLRESEAAVEQAAGMQGMVMEMEILRAQLNDVRRQLIKRDVEEEAGTMAPRAVMDREQQGRSVYEGIIHDLRAELDRMNNKYHETSRRCEEALRNAARVEQLEEEIQMYKEMARHVSVESQR